MMENCDRRKSWTLVTLPPGSVPVCARFRPIHCSKKPTTATGILEIRTFVASYMAKFSNPQSRMTSSWWRLCARVKDCLLLIVLSPNFASVTDYNQRLLAELKVRVAWKWRDFQDRALITIISV